MKKRIVHTLSNVSLIASHGLEEDKPADSPPQPPMIILNFLYPELHLVNGILVPYARPKHVLAGYFCDDDGEMVLGCYMVVPVPQPDESDDHLFVFGTHAGISEKTMKIWQDQRVQFGKFIVASGLVSEEHPGKPIFTTPSWFCICTEFHLTNLIPMVFDRITSPSS